MRRRGGRGWRGRSSSPRLLDQLRDFKRLGLQELRPLERPGGMPAHIEVGTATGERDERFVVVAATRDGADLLGWAQVACALAGGDGAPPALLIAAPAFLGGTRRAAERLADEGTATHLAAIPGLAAGDGEAQVLESFPRRARTQPGSTLDRVLRTIEGASAVTGVGSLRETPGGHALYMRGTLVLRIRPDAGAVQVECVEPERRQIQISEANFARWGLELHEMVLGLAQDPRLLEGDGAACDAAVQRIGDALRVRVTARYLAWSFDGSEPLDWVGIDSNGRPVLGLIRKSVGLRDVPAVVAALELFEEDREAWAPGAQGRPRLIVSSDQVEPRVRSLLVALGLDVQVRSGDLRAGAARPAAAAPPELAADLEHRTRRRGRRRRRGRAPASEREEAAEGALEPAAEEAEPADEAEPVEAPAGEERSEAPVLAEAEAAEEYPELEEPEPLRAAEPGEAPAAREQRAGPELEEIDEELAEAAEEEPAEGEGPGDEQVEADHPKRPKRLRAAIVARDDPDAVLAALVLARERRNVAQFWVCSQESLMDYFKTGATDLPENVDVLLVGFTAQPIPHEVIRTAGLYRGRLQWFDHHEWPIEDLERLRESIGRDSIVFAQNTATSLAAVMQTCERRSRFTDKLVDLSGRRLSENDMRKWGYRTVGLLQKLAAEPGDHRADVQPILAGKPADLPEAKGVYEAEDAWIQQHDPRIVYFGEYGMVVVRAPRQLDAGEVARRMRLQTGARLSLASREGDDIVALGCNEEKRHINAIGLVEQIGERLPWAHARTGGDRLGRLWVEDLPGHPERLETLIGEVVRNKSILYG